MLNQFAIPGHFFGEDFQSGIMLLVLIGYCRLCFPVFLVKRPMIGQFKDFFTFAAGFG
jgi:hypothetical protein